MGIIIPGFSTLPCKLCGEDLLGCEGSTAVAGVLQKNSWSRGHTFHSSCLSVVENHGNITCPVCSRALLWEDGVKVLSETSGGLKYESVHRRCAKKLVQ